MRALIKLLHVHHSLMNLYGDWANPCVLERELTARGYEVFLDKKSVGDKVDYGTYDFIFIGSGTERSQLACMRDLARNKETLIERIDAGIPVLATGNSHELFGLAVTDSAGACHTMLGLIDFETVQLSTRITGDCLCTATFLDEKLIGFINRAGGKQEGDIERPFYIEPREGANYTASAEGIRYKNLLGTYMTGPILVRNPPLLKFFADIVTGESEHSHTSPGDQFFEFQEKAYNTALREYATKK